MAGPDEVDEDIIKEELENELENRLKDELEETGYNNTYKRHCLEALIPEWEEYLDSLTVFKWVEQIDGSVTYHSCQSNGSHKAGALLELVSKKSDEFIAIVYPVGLREEFQAKASQEKTTVAKDEIRKELNETALSFWRSLGFRRISSSSWLGYSPDAQHKSHSIAASEDFDLPAEFQKTVVIRNFDCLVESLSEIMDMECLAQLEKIFQDADTQDTRWEATDKEGNTVLHLMVCSFKVKSIKWVLERNHDLLTRRNAAGELPLETFEAAMEEERTIQQRGAARIYASDQSRGIAAAIWLLMRQLHWGFSQSSNARWNDGQRNLLKGRITRRHALAIEETNSMFDRHVEEFEDARRDGEDLDALRKRHAGEMEMAAKREEAVARAE
ncbi:hypothetical protein BDV19DRAFT_384194 [Aspergillus venezuelensis]